MYNQYQTRFFNLACLATEEGREKISSFCNNSYTEEECMKYGIKVGSCASVYESSNGPTFLFERKLTNEGALYTKVYVVVPSDKKAARLFFEAEKFLREMEKEIYISKVLKNFDSYVITVLNAANHINAHKVIWGEYGDLRGLDDGNSFKCGACEARIPKSARHDWSTHDGKLILAKTIEAVTHEKSVINNIDFSEVFNSIKWKIDNKKDLGIAMDSLGRNEEALTSAYERCIDVLVEKHGGSLIVKKAVETIQPFVVKELLEGCSGRNLWNIYRSTMDKYLENEGSEKHLAQPGLLKVSD